MEDAENAIIAYAKEQVRRESLPQSVDTNQQALELSTQLYKGGLTDFLHVLDSERSLYAAASSLSGSRWNGVDLMHQSVSVEGYIAKPSWCLVVMQMWVALPRLGGVLRIT
jgi:hypothetical protein